MTIEIRNPGDADHENSISFPAVRVSTDPEQRYAVAEKRGGLFVAFRLSSCDGESMTGEYLNHYRYDYSDIPMLQGITADWSCIEYGFCKLNLFAPEMVNEFGGSFDKTLCRFYFDWERYKICYEKINGVACTRQDPNQSADFTAVQKLLKH